MEEEIKAMRIKSGLGTCPFNLAAVRDLVLDAIMPGEVEYFCFGHALFDPVCDLIAPNASHLKAVHELVKFSRRNHLIPELLSAIRDYNPRQYQRYRGRIFTEAEDQLVLDPTHDSHIRKRRGGELSLKLKCAGGELTLNLGLVLRICGGAVYSP